MENHDNAFQGADIASLSASAVAAAVSVFLSPGPYGWVSFVVSLTLLIIIVSAYYQRSRNAFQSIAVAAAIALACVPGAGFVLETAPTTSAISTVPERSLAVAWAVVLVLVAVADILIQRRRDEPMPPGFTTRQ